ncbi:MarR family winged helix-turn-helix transcriptional regulator [Phaeovulum sp. W22_SRMD_FR3]|uniref:MarR family winged helix-turn-helix transcriptional regulator n=1 Tax=Phaeovulum sp. W22_SRMD_FR3 TaxID=3240274 RepID=UPI003F9C22FB
MKNNAPDSLGLLLHDASRLIRRRFEAAAADLGLSSAQWRLLVQLAKIGRATQARLAERLEIEPISVSRLVDRMQESGWVTREPDPQDRRAKVIVPTEKALALYTDLRGRAEGVYEQAQTGIPAEERAVLMRVLKTIIANLASDDETGCLPPCVNETEHDR